MDYLIICLCAVVAVVLGIFIGYKMKENEFEEDFGSGQLIIGYDDGVPYIFLETDRKVEELKKMDHVILRISIANDER